MLQRFLTICLMLVLLSAVGFSTGIILHPDAGNGQRLLNLTLTEATYTRAAPEPAVASGCISSMNGTSSGVCNFTGTAALDEGVIWLMKLPSTSVSEIYLTMNLTPSQALENASIAFFNWSNGGWIRVNGSASNRTTWLVFNTSCNIVNINDIQSTNFQLTMLMIYSNGTNLGSLAIANISATIQYTASAGSSLTAADVWNYGDRTTTGGNITTVNRTNVTDNCINCGGSGGLTAAQANQLSRIDNATQEVNKTVEEINLTTYNINNTVNRIFNFTNTTLDASINAGYQNFSMIQANDSTFRAVVYANLTLILNNISIIRNIDTFMNQTINATLTEPLAQVLTDVWIQATRTLTSFNFVINVASGNVTNVTNGVNCNNCTGTTINNINNTNQTITNTNNISGTTISGSCIGKDYEGCSFRIA